ncbi:MAG: CheR family methyltransferase [Microcoleaceae cyanobacterium]
MKSQQENQFFVVGIGASAGGLQPLEQFFSNLPDQPNAAFIVVQHQSPNFKSLLTQLLQRKTTLKVHTIEDQMIIAPSSVYVVPPGKYLQLEISSLRLLDSPSEFHYPINRFFKSLAQEWGERAIGILVYGTGSDGTEGLEAIGKNGGVALVQSPETAQFTSMSNSAIASGLVDEILSPAELAQAVYDIVRLAGNSSEREFQDSPLIPVEQLEEILDIIFETQGIDFSHYKTSTLSRRITHRSSISRYGKLENYIHNLKKSPVEQEELCQDLLISATSFFRDYPAWEYLQTKILPELIEKAGEEQKQLRIWVSACATGEEAYSMAMLVDETMRQTGQTINVKIFGTDLDSRALETAAKGIYSETITNDISSERLERYFSYEAGSYRVKRSLREMLIFAPHDLNKNPGFSRMDLISCRNVLIYMQPKLQQHVLRLLHFSLGPQGILFLGNTETLGELEEEFITEQPQWKIYRKRREVKLSLSSLTRKPVVLPAVNNIGNNYLSKSKFNRSKFDQVLAEVFNFSFGERQVTCLLVSLDNRLMNVFYNEAKLLEVPIGQPNLEVTEMILPELKLPLGTAMHRAQRDKQSVLYTGIKIYRNDSEENVTLRVGYNPDNALLDEFLIVLLEVETPSPFSLATTSEETTYDVAPEVAKRMSELEYELQQTRENLQAAVEELETINEEQQATNEELLASNEELQSTNEELQSVNEELYTINTEYELKIEELTTLNEDIDNLLRSTDIGVVFLDKELNIRRFTPAATTAINIRGTDIDRPLNHFTHNLNCPDLIEILKQAIETQQSMEREVSLSTTGECILLRINSYIQEDGNADGIVMTLININELKNAQGQLQRTNNLLETLYESIPVGLSLVDQELRYLRINSVLAEINGCSVSEHIGKTISDILPQLAEQLTPLYRQVLETGEAIRNLEICAPVPSNPEIEACWLTTYYPVDLEDKQRLVGAVVTDITQLKQTQQQLLESQSLVRQITESSPGIIHIFDLERNCVTYINASVSQLLGYTQDEILELDSNVMSTLVHPEDIERMRNHYQSFQNVADQEVVEIEYSVRHKDGFWMWLYTREVVFKRGPTGKVIEVLGVDTNISDRKQAQQRLEQLNATLEQRVQTRTAELETAKKKAEVANQAKSEFLSRMTHELRTPLNIILGFTQLLSRETNLDSKQKNQLEIISKSGHHLLELIEEVLDLSKLEANRMELEPSFFDFQDQMTYLEEMFQGTTENKGLELRFEIDSEVPQYIHADERKLRQVLINLLSNAIKFTETGYVNLKVRTENILKDDAPKPSAYDLTSRLVFEVQDTGIGMSQQDIEKIFDAFVQGEAGRRSQAGTGLGLSISRRFVQLMGGDIKIDSSIDGGTTITFSIIVNSIPDTTPTEQPAGKQQIVGLAPNQPEYRILVVDDWEDNRKLLSLMLGILGFQILEAANGQEAIEQWQQHKPQLIFMDLRMPIMNGFEAIKSIKSHPEGEATAIVALSASGTLDREKFSFLKANCPKILTKPVQEDILLKCLAECLGVQYIYGSSAGNTSSASSAPSAPIRPRTEIPSSLSNLSKDALSFMSAEFRFQLHDALLNCSSENVIALLEQIPQEHQQLKEILMELAVDYQFDIIDRLLEDVEEGGRW